MRIFCDQLTRDEWAPYSEWTHVLCFGKHKPRAWDRIDFALIVRTDDVPLGYVTCRELDAHSVYWQFGGSFPGTKGTVLSWGAVQAFVEHLFKTYRRISFYVENSNQAMLKMAMKLGFRIVGLRNFEGSILLEHLLERQEVSHHHV